MGLFHVGQLLKNEGIMRKDDYLNILQTHPPNFLDQCANPEPEITFQLGGDPKHTAKIV
ncbi:hypothetical protein KR059_005812, partial [Drosophila kikkawai]